MTTFYFFSKAIHIIGFVSWFAGLFYLGRMFVYHVEANDFSESEANLFKSQYSLMQRRAYQIICNPAMMITWIAGLIMLGLGIWRPEIPNYLDPKVGVGGWLHAKLMLVVLMTVYHLWCKRTIRNLEAEKKTYSDFQFRLLNEVPTLFLVSITFLATFGLRGILNYLYLFGGMIAFIGLLYWGARAYKKRRESLAQIGQNP